MQVVVVGNVALDILCSPVDDVPRDSSIAFDRSVVSPGGCGSNVAIGLCALGVPTALVAYTGQDVPAQLLEQYWEKWGVDCRYIRRSVEFPTSVSVGLINSQAQPRFIHTPGANRCLNSNDIQPEEYLRQGARILHIAGYFVLPGLMDVNLSRVFSKSRQACLLTALDVVESPYMNHPDALWSCMPHLDYFLCNQREGEILTGINEPASAARKLQQYGARNVIVKLGAAGCWISSETWQGMVEGFRSEVVDTTGAGDAFAAGLLTALVEGKDSLTACQEANKAGALMVGKLGAISGWEV